MLNSSSESSHSLDEFAETTLKSFVSGDRMSFQQKFREPIEARPTAKVMVSTNQLPQFSDKSMGVWRRMLFVPFEKTYPPDSQNPNLIEELSQELPGIFNWAYEGMKLLCEAGGFLIPAKCRQALEQYHIDVNPARAFLLDNYRWDANSDGLPTQDVYRAYVLWCSENGYKPMNSSNFGKEVKRVFPNANLSQPRLDSKRFRVYAGLNLRQDSQVTGSV